MITDLQFGSTGKGLIAGYLAVTDPPDTVTCAWGPNAGHTYIDQAGNKYIHTMLPNGVVSPALEQVLIGPGASVNIPALVQEINDFEAANPGRRIREKVFIHEHAAVVLPEHKEREQAFQRIGSTSKGTAEAIIDKLRRDPLGSATVGQNMQLLAEHGLSRAIVKSDEYAERMWNARSIQAEGAQGFSLGLNQRFYPFSTSRECTPIQVMSDCGIPIARSDFNFIGTMRTYPIRVANRFDGNGKQIGTSGPCYPDQREISFEAIGQPVELTTVTKLPRRVFTFSFIQLRDALRQTGAEDLFINFLNYIQDDDNRDEFVRVVHAIAKEHGARVAWLGMGPAHQHIEEVPDGAA